MISATIKDKKQKHYDGAILAWVITASFLSLLDLILLFILSHDYHIAEDQYYASSLPIGVSKLLTVFTPELMCYSTYSVNTFCHWYRYDISGQRICFVGD